MKKSTLLAISAIAVMCLVALTAFNSTTRDTAANQPYILIEIYEIPSYPDRGIHIHYGNNKRELIPFKGMDVEHHDDAGDLVLATVNKFVEQGYHIESTAAGLDQAGMITKIFMRKK